MSEYTRRNYADGNGMCFCYTCGTQRPWKAMHCGHYIPRTESPTRHDPRNLRPQDSYCNTFRSGMPHVFRERLVDEIGLDEVLDIEEKSKQRWKWNRADLEAQIIEYRQLVKEMER